MKRTALCYRWQRYRWQQGAFDFQTHPTSGDTLLPSPSRRAGYGRTWEIDVKL